MLISFIFFKDIHEHKQTEIHTRETKTHTETPTERETQRQVQTE